MSQDLHRLLVSSEFKSSLSRKNGLLLKNNSSEDLARIIHDVFANEYDLGLISRNALDLIRENANWQENMEKLKNLILAL